MHHRTDKDEYGGEVYHQMEKIFSKSGHLTNKMEQLVLFSQEIPSAVIIYKTYEILHERHNLQHIIQRIRL